jgi:hypothetical protein
LSIYDSLNNLNEPFKSHYQTKHFENRPFFGSPVIAYFDLIKNVFKEESKKIENLKEQKIKEVEQYTIDEAHNKRKELIEEFTNNVALYEKAKKDKIIEEITEDLNDFRLNNMKLIDNSNWLEKEFKKKEYELLSNNSNNSQDNNNFDGKIFNLILIS